MRAPQAARQVGGLLMVLRLGAILASDLERSFELNQPLRQRLDLLLQPQHLLAKLLLLVLGEADRFFEVLQSLFRRSWFVHDSLAPP